MSRSDRRIVVGVDDSIAAAAALRWAVDEGARRGDVVEAVHVRRGSIASSVMGQEHALEELELSIAHALGERVGGSPVRRRVVDGPAGQALVTAAATADLLVVGCNRRGALGEAFLGSVSHYCIRHSVCPVVVVPVTPEAEAERVFATDAVSGV